MRPFDAVALCSGGMDSTTLAYWLRGKGMHVLPLFLNYGQHCARREHDTLLAVLPDEMRTDVVALDVSCVYSESRSRMIQEADLWSDGVTDDALYLPYRNLVMLSLAVAYAQSRCIGAVYAAFINTNHAKEIDCSVAFFRHLDSLLSAYGQVEIRLPFRHYDKRQVAAIGLQLGVPIALTFSCQASSEVPCGACPNCVERLDALSHVSSAHASGGC